MPPPVLERSLILWLSYEKDNTIFTAHSDTKSRATFVVIHYYYLKVWIVRKYIIIYIINKLYQIMKVVSISLRPFRGSILNSAIKIGFTNNVINDWNRCLKNRLV